VSAVYENKLVSENIKEYKRKKKKKTEKETNMKMSKRKESLDQWSNEDEPPATSSAP